MSFTLISTQCHLVEKAFFRCPEAWILFFSSLQQKNLPIRTEGRIYCSSQCKGIKSITAVLMKVRDGVLTSRQTRKQEEMLMLGLSWLPPLPAFHSIWTTPPPVHGMTSAIFSAGLPSSAKLPCKHPHRDAWRCASLAILNPVKLTAKITHDNIFIGVTIRHVMKAWFLTASILSECWNNQK